MVRVGVEGNNPKFRAAIEDEKFWGTGRCFLGIFLWFMLLQILKLDSIFNHCKYCSMMQFMFWFFITLYFGQHLQP